MNGDMKREIISSNGNKFMEIVCLYLRFNAIL